MAKVQHKANINNKKKKTKWKTGENFQHFPHIMKDVPEE